jgi:D-sedoheptulose 7-phosphate isomerase
MHSKNFLKETTEITKLIDSYKIEKISKELAQIKKNNGRIFFLGVGGSAGNCSHAVNDFRKLCKIECYTPTDNVSELTARINDEGWDSSFVEWLKINNCTKTDAIFIMSVGGGNIKRNVSVNLIKAIKFARLKKMKIFGIVGKINSYTEKNSDICIQIPVLNQKWVTPQSEAFQSVIWHCLVSNPVLQKTKTKW